MILPEKIALIDSMIKENAEYTIREYLELVREIEDIEAGVPGLPGYPPGPIKTKWPWARLFAGRSPILTSSEHSKWQARDKKFELQLIMEKYGKQKRNTKSYAQPKESYRRAG